MTDDVEIIILKRFQLGPVPVPGSIVVTANCGHRAWIAPTGQAYLATPHGAGAYLMCTKCEGRVIINQEIERRSVPGSMAEVSATWGTGYGDQVSAFLRDVGVKPQ